MAPGAGSRSLRRPRPLAALLVLGLLVPLLTLTAARASTATLSFVVDQMVDQLNPGACGAATAGRCSLREAIVEVDQAAAAGPVQATITVPPGTYTFTRSKSATGADTATGGDLVISPNAGVTVNGAGASATGTVIDAATIDRHFAVLQGAALTLDNLDLTNGQASSSHAGGSYPRGAGGSILVAGTLTVGGARSGVLFDSNVASGSGGAIEGVLTTSSITVANSYFRNNVAADDGGAISTAHPVAAPGGSLGVSDTYFTGNQATGKHGTAGGGGAVIFGGPGYLAGSSVVSNTASGEGGGVVTSQGNALVNDTIANNRVTSSGAGGGGLMTSAGGSALVYSTVVGNAAPAGEATQISTNAGIALRDAVFQGASPLCTASTPPQDLGHIVQTDKTCDASASVTPAQAVTLQAVPAVPFAPVAVQPHINPPPTAARLIPLGAPECQVGATTRGVTGVPFPIDADELGNPRPNGTACDAGAIQLPDPSPAGTVLSWGNPASGQLASSAIARGEANGTVPVLSDLDGVPSGQSVVQVTGGQQDTFALTNQGQVYSWGSAAHLQTAHGGGTAAGQVPLPVTATAIAAFPNSFTGLAVGADSNLYGWGDNSGGQIGTAGLGSDVAPQVIGGFPAGTSFAAVSVGAAHSLALTTAGTVYAWGTNTGGDLGPNAPTGAATGQVYPVPLGLAQGEAVAAVIAGQADSFALTTQGRILAWGTNTGGDLGTGSATPAATASPVVVSLPAGVTATAVSSGANFAEAVTPSGLYSWGSNDLGQLGTGNPGASAPAPAPVPLPAGSAVESVTNGANFALAHVQTPAGDEVLGWGFDSVGQLGNALTANSPVPVRTLLPAGVGIQAVAGAGFHAMAIVGPPGSTGGTGGGGGPPPPPPGQASVTLSTAPTVPAGAQIVPESAVTTTALPATSTPSATAVASTALGSIALGSIALGSIALGSIALGSIALGSIALGSITLSQAPLNSSAGTTWAALLSCTGQTVGPSCSTADAGLPEQSLTLAQVVTLPQVQSLALGSIDLTNTALGSIALGSIALGSIALGSIPIPGPGPTPAANWCALITAAGKSCAAGTALDPSTATLLDLSLAGVPSSAIPWSSISLGGVLPALQANPQSSALGSIALGSIDLSSSALGSIALGSINLGSTALGSIALGSIALGSIALGSIPLTQIPPGDLAQLVTCQPGSPGNPCAAGTLGQIPPGAFLPGATLALLCSFPGTNGAASLCSEPAFQTTLAQLAAGGAAGLGGTTLLQLLEALPPAVLNSLLVSDVLTGLLPRASYPWQSVDLQAAHLQQSADNGGISTYDVSLTVTGGPAAPTLTVTLPPGFAYRPGSATLRGAALADPTVKGSTLTWSLPSLPVGVSALVFQAFSALTLGAAAATATVTSPGQSAPPPSTASTDVTDAFAPAYRSPSTPQPLAAGTLTLGYLGQPGLADWFSLVVNPGQELSISLSNLPADYDLTLYSPAAAPLRDAPVQNMAPVADPNALDPPGAQTAPPIAAQDLGLTTQPVYALSDNRGTTNEVINTSPLPAGTYVVEVSGYNGATSPDPYLLRAQVLNTQSGPACVAPRTLGSQQPLIGMPSLPANVNTIFLANTERLAALYGVPTATAIVNAATSVANDSADGVVGAVIPVETTGTVAADYAAWDANRCSVAAANAVVSGIGRVVDNLRRARPSIRNVVLLGDDSQIPSARVPDTTTLSNERGFAQDFTGPANELTAALAAGDLLTDAPYVNSTPLGVGSGSLFLPEIAVGRLVSTPSEIIGALNRFVSNHGGLNDTTGLSTGYDFLSDGAQSVAANLGLVPARQVTQLVSNPTCTPQPPVVNGPAAGSTWPVGSCWTASNLETALGQDPNLASVNAHFDPSRLLPANGNQTGNQTAGLFTTSDLRSMFASTPGLLGGSLLFSMGCHAGLELPANEFGQSIDSWDEAFADEGAIWVANTGYGYGDTASVALSEQLMAGFAANLNESMTVGDALTFAKQTYAGGLAVVSPYDMKVLMESTFYGLPMYHLRSTPPAPTSRLAGPPTTTDPLSGLTVAPESASLTPGTGTGQLGLVSTPLGNYYQVNTTGTVTGSVQATEYRPLQPKLTLDVTQPAPTGGGLATVAHGAVLTGLCSQDVLGFHPKIVRPVIDSGANEPPLAPADATFPSVLQSITTLQAPNGAHQQLVLVPGQFNSAQGTERLFTCLSANVLYANPSDTVAATDFTQPTIVSALGEVTGGVATFRVSVTAGVAAEPVKGVVVLYTSGGGVWQRANLVAGPGGVWTGGGPASGTALAWFVQAFDAAGNVAVASDKGDYFAATPSAPVAGSVVFGVPPVPASGFYSAPVPVRMTDTAGTPITYTLDGATVSGVPSGTVVTVSGPGVHQLSATTGSGPPSSISIAIESGPPSAAISAPLPGTAYVVNQPAPAVFTCSDGFAVTSCTGTVDGAQPVTSGGALPTSAVGTHTLVVSAVNAAGAQATATVTYAVGYQICNIQELGLNAQAPVPLVLDVCDFAGTNLSSSGIAVTASTLDGRAAPNNLAASGTRAFLLVPPVPPNFPPPKVATEPSYAYEMKGLPRGTHTLTFTTGADPTPHSLSFTLGP